MKNKNKNRNEETYKIVLIVLLLLVLILGGYVYFDKIRVLDKTISQIQAGAKGQVVDFSSNVLINKDILLDALSEEEMKTNFPSIVKNVHGFEVEYQCVDYNDVDGCNNIHVIIKPFNVH